MHTYIHTYIHIYTEHVIQNQSSLIPVIENMFYTLDIYNDAAYRALYVLTQQHLYDEIEAEVNLVFDQFVIQLAKGVYSYFKDMAAYSNLDRGFKVIARDSYSGCIISFPFDAGKNEWADRRGDDGGGVVKMQRRDIHIWKCLDLHIQRHRPFAERIPR